MSLFQTSYHVNAWISISLLHISSSTSVIKIYQHFTNLVSPHKKRRRIQTQETLHYYILDSPPGPVCQSAHLGHLPSPCSMKNPTLSTTLNWDDPQPPDPTFIHIKLGWSSPCLFIAPLRITKPTVSPTIWIHVPSYVFALHLPNSKVSWCHRWKPDWRCFRWRWSPDV